MLATTSKTLSLFFILLFVGCGSQDLPLRGPERCNHNLDLGDFCLRDEGWRCMPGTCAKCGLVLFCPRCSPHLLGRPNTKQYFSIDTAETEGRKE